MSIADGQTVLRHTGGGDTEGVSVDARLSVSRIGSRAFPLALEALAPQIRCHEAPRPCTACVLAAGPCTSPDTTTCRPSRRRSGGAATTPQPSADHVFWLFDQTLAVGPYSTAGVTPEAYRLPSVAAKEAGRSSA